MLHIPGFLKFWSSRNFASGRSSGERNGQSKGYFARHCAFGRFPTVHQSTTEIATPRCGRTMFWLFPVISLLQFRRWKFRNILVEYSSYLSTYLKFRYGRRLPFQMRVYSLLTTLWPKLGCPCIQNSQNLSIDACASPKNAAILRPHPFLGTMFIHFGRWHDVELPLSPLSIKMAS